MVNGTVGLMRASGSLFIDVFDRHGFTSDGNAMLIGLLEDFAEAEIAVGNATQSDLLLAEAGALRKAMQAHLWAGTNAIGRGGDDHFVTEMNDDRKSYYDMVDYDANLIAVAHGTPADDNMARRVLARVDRGNCTAVKGAGPQFVSEGCYDMNHRTGDCSEGDWCSMGRIGYYDGLARKRLGLRESFDDHILAPLQRDVIKYTWLHERYSCQGTQATARTAAYFEFPSVVAMLTREVRYGIELGLRRVTIDPLQEPGAKFVFAIGNVRVDYHGHKQANKQVTHDVFRHVSDAFGSLLGSICLIVVCQLCAPAGSVWRADGAAGSSGRCDFRSLFCAPFAHLR